MKDENPASQLADKLSRFDRAVWDRFPKTIRKAVADYKEADDTTRQRIVNRLHKTIEKHGKTLLEIRFGEVQRKALFGLALENRTTVERRLKDRLDTVQDEFYAHFPGDKDELARRLESGKFFQTGQDWWFSRVLVRQAITLLKDIASSTKKEVKRKGKKAKAKSIKDRFTFNPGQVIFDNKRDLGLPSGEPVDMFKTLVENLGSTVSYIAFDQHHSSTSPGTVCKSACKIRQCLEECNVPCELATKTGEGYVLQEISTPTARKKRVTKKS